MRYVSAFAALIILSGAPTLLAQQLPAAAPAPAQAASVPQPPALFPQGAKIAFIDFERIANESAEGKAFAARIGALIKAKQGQADDRSKQIQANQQKLESSGSLMSETARAQLEREIDKQRVDAERFQQDAQAEITETQQQVNTEFQKKLIPVLKQVAQEKGLQILLSRADAGIIWGDPGLDLSADVVRKMDADAKAKQ